MLRDLPLVSNAKPQKYSKHQRRITMETDYLTPEDFYRGMACLGAAGSGRYRKTGWWNEERIIALLRNEEPAIPHPNCRDCTHYHGETYNGTAFICAMHPHGWEEGNCPDKE